MKTTENGENIYKIMNVWLRNCRSILAYMTKEIKDTKRDREENAWRTVAGFQ